MANRQDGNVVHRPSRGRTLPGTKNKTDSGCFVDEEIEKLATNTTTRKPISHASTVNTEIREKPSENSEESSQLTDLNQNLNLPTSSDISVSLNNKYVSGMGDETTFTPESTSPDSSAGKASIEHDVINRKVSSGFYCLCYDDLAEENSPTIDDQPHLNLAPPFDSHDDPEMSGTVEKHEEVSNARTLDLGPTPQVANSRISTNVPTEAHSITEDNREVSSSEVKHFHTELHIAVNSSNHVPLACVEEDDLSFVCDVEEEMHPKMSLEKKYYHCSSKGRHPAGSEMSVGGVPSHRYFTQTTDTQSSEERYNNTDALLDSLCFPDSTAVCGLQSAGNIFGESHHKDYRDVTANRLSSRETWDEADGACVPGTGQWHLNDNCVHDEAYEKSVLARVKEIEELQVIDHVAPKPAKKRPVSLAGYPVGWSQVDMPALKHRSWSVCDTNQELDKPETDYYTSREEGQTVLSRVQGFEEMWSGASQRLPEAVSDPAVHKTGNLAKLLLGSVSNVERPTVQDPEQGRRDEIRTGNTILPSRIVEGAKEDLLSELAMQRKAQFKGRRSGSFSTVPDNHSDSPPPSSTAWNRRSWSVCDKTTQDLAFPFVGEEHPLPAVRTTNSQQFRDFKASPFVRRVQNSEKVRRRHSTPYRQEFTPERPQSCSGFELTEQPRGYPQYWSDNSSISSEAEFSPRGARHWKKGLRLSQSCSGTYYDNSSASDFSAAESEMSSLGQRRHSLNSKQPFNVSQRQFSEGSDSESETRLTLDPRVKALRRLSSNTCSSSSDSEVERYFKEPVKGARQDVLAKKPRKKTSAMEALYGRNSSRPNTPGSEDLLQGFGTNEHTLSLSDRFTARKEDAHDTTLTKEENKSGESESLELEFDDTDYSEFYTRCEDQQSILTAEALHVKEVLAKMKGIEEAVPEETDAEQAAHIPQESLSDDTDSFSNETDYSADSCSVAIQTEEEDDWRGFSSRRRSRGTQTPPPYSPMKKSPTRDREAQTPPPPPSKSKAISAEELLEILSSLSTGNLSTLASHKPARKSLSMQRYNYRPDFLAPQDRASSMGSISTGSENSWQHSTEHHGSGRNTLNQYAGQSRRPPLYSQSYDCIRRDLFGNQEDIGHTPSVGRTSIHEELMNYKDSKMKQPLFEEEVDCIKAKSEGNIKNSSLEELGAAERPVSISFVGSEPTETIEAEVKLAGPVHSLKRKRAGKIIIEESQDEEEVIAASDQTTRTAENDELVESGEEGDSSGDSSEVSDDEERSDGDSKENDTQSVNVFIDYRKKNVMHVVCNSSNGNDDSSETGLVGGQSSSTPGRELASPNGYDKGLYSIKEERSPSFDAESISSSQSSEDDAFGSFSGSNETVVFVGTATEKVPDTSLLDSVLGMGIGNCLQETEDGDVAQGLSDLDAILGRVRKSVDFEVLDSSVLDQAIERFKQRVSPSSQDKITGGMTMEAFVALNQADELEDIINEIKRELKLLQDENSILRKKVVNLANDQTMDVTTDEDIKNRSSTEPNTVLKPNGTPKISSSKHRHVDKDVDQNTKQEQVLKLDADLHECSSPKQSEPVQHTNSSRDTGSLPRSTAVYKSSKKHHETDNHLDNSSLNGTVKGIEDNMKAQRQTDMHVNAQNGQVPVEGSDTLHECLRAGQHQTDKQVDRMKRPKINGVCERPPMRHRITVRAEISHTKETADQEVNLQRDCEMVEVDVCLRCFAMVPGVPIPLKKTDVRLGTVAVKPTQEDVAGVVEAAKKTFVDHVKEIDDENCLGLGPHSIQGVQAGVAVWTPGPLNKHQSPRAMSSRKNNPCVVQLKDGNHFSCDTVVYDTLLPRDLVEYYALQLLEHKYLIFCGVPKLGKSHLASKLAEQVVQRIGWNKSPAVVTFNVGDMTRKDLKQKLSTLLQCDLSSAPSGTPAVIILDQLNFLASMSDIFDVSQLEGNSNSPYIIGVRDKSKKGPFTSKDLNLHQYFRWIQVSVFDKQYCGMLGRFLKRKLLWAGLSKSEETQQLLELFEWLSLVWKHINDILVDYCDPDSTLGPSLFFSCPMNFKAAERWFTSVWNYTVIPHLHQRLRTGKKIFDRDTVWEDPTRWVILRYPWQRENSKTLGTLRKLRQVDVVLNRNNMGQESVGWAECHEVDERIRRSHSLRSRSPGTRPAVRLTSTTPRNSSHVSSNGSISSSGSFSVRRGARLGTGV